MVKSRMDAVNTFDTRHSTPSRLLSEPGPNAQQLQQLLTCAVHVPDHGKLTPWRFISITGDTRHQLGKLLVTRFHELNPQVSAAVLEKERLRFSYAPLIIAVIAHPFSGHNVPEIEQILSGGAVCFSLLRSAQAMGFGAQWLTGWAAYDPVIARHLRLAENERILGFIHLGTVKESVPGRDRPDPMTLLSELRL